MTGRLKHWLLRRATGVSISRAIAGHVVPSRVIGNPYDDVVFREMPGLMRYKELVFCGRLVSEKGAALLLNAL